ncbi:hypothetical protein FGKAn22_02390 [Ferrigenium kumadai]|uniref:Uncharacterized protein n=1 Tax=Ferrigenium kumadai TaxID=1682490 RepID=A0AAN1SXT5_9PROT|nr:pentapeptide repeat-containing protein [Ferrigenium kumadai]BBI98546.1 hypothetical protein FGKAn22_02390 [Ferrigenium kumadai]
MSEVPNSESLESIVKRLRELERLALANFLSGKPTLYIAHADEPVRVCEDSNSNKQHNVYKVDVESVQKYLDEVGHIVERFVKEVPSDSGVPNPIADLRFLEIHDDVDHPLNDHLNTLVARSSINFAYSKFHLPIELQVVTKFSILDLLHTHCECPFFIRVDHGTHVEVRADKIVCDGEFGIEAYTPSRKQLPAFVSIKLEHGSFHERVIFAFLKIKDAKCLGASFGKKVRVHKVDYEGITNFINSKFKGGALFSNCSFALAPDFHGAELHQDTIFQDCSFDSSNSEIANIASFRVLKAHFGKMRDSKHELMFYALEQRAERKSAKNGPIVSTISWLYDEISEYGSSVDRSAKFFIFWNINFFLFFYLAVVGSSQKLVTVKNEALDNYPALMLTLQNIFNPLALFSEKQLASVNSIAIYVASLIQSFGALATLTLMLLAIRGRFRKGGGADT